jgi:hypothetical protein
MDNTYGCPKESIGHYQCLRTPDPITINGRLDHEVWQKAPKSPRFVDMVTGVPGFLDTRMAAVWDDTYLYVGFWVEEPNVCATFTERDSYVYLENDVEVFIGGEECYYEFQINALGTIYEVFYIWQKAYTPGSRFDTEEFNLLKRNVDVLGGFQDPMRNGKHPEGKRWAIMDWDFPGLKTAVHVKGKINDPYVVDSGWTVEIAFPWEGMKALANQHSIPPKDGETLRMDFSRFQALNYNGVNANPHPGWSFNPHGVYDSHIPECFTYVHFSKALPT